MTIGQKSGPSTDPCI